MGKDDYMTRIGIAILALALLCSCSSVARDDGLLQSGSPPLENVRSVQQRIVTSPPLCGAGYPPKQRHDQLEGEYTVAVPAEGVDPAIGSAFSVEPQPLAQNWNILKAPSTSVSTPTAPFATYRVNFRRTGDYTLWVRARGFSAGQNSIFLPTDFSTNPSTPLDIPEPWNTDGWVWTKAGSYHVENPGNRAFKIGHRGRNTELDTLVFVFGNANYSDAELDGYAGYLEAENADLSDDVSSDFMTTASGGQRVGGFQDVGDSLEFSSVPAGRINIRYYLNSDSTYEGLGRQASVYLKGTTTNDDWQDVATAHFPVTGSNSTWDTTFVYLPGAGEVRFQIDADDYTANQGDFSASFDYISFVDGGFTCQADSASLAAAVAHDSPWDTVILPKSSCAIPNGWYNDLPIVVEKNGSADRPFSLRAHTAGRVHLTGDSSIKVTGDHVVVDGLAFFGGIEGTFSETAVISVTGNYNRLTNTTIIGHNPSVQEDEANEWVHVTGQHNRIDHNHFENKAYRGQSLRGDDDNQADASYIVIDHNYFGPRPPRSEVCPTACDKNGWEAITVGMAQETPHVGHHVLKYNLFEDADGEGAETPQQLADAEALEGLQYLNVFEDQEVVSIKNSGAYLYYNTFKDNRGHLALRKGDAVHVEGNVFRDQALGIRVFGADHTIINNYFDDVGTGLWVPAVLENSGVSCYTPVEKLIVAHNTFAATSPALSFLPFDGCDEGGEWIRAVQIVVANNHVGDAQENWPVEPVDMPDEPEDMPDRSEEVPPVPPVPPELVGPLDVSWFSNYAAIDAPPPGLPEGAFEFSPVDMAIPNGSDTLLRGAGPANATSAAEINYEVGWGEYPVIEYDVDGNARGNPARVGADEPVDGNVVIAPQDRSQVGPSWGHRFVTPIDPCN